MKKLILTLVILVFVGNTNVWSQTKPKTQAKPKTSAKAPAKKKAPPAAINVYVCTSNKDKFYHKRSTCGGLNKCSEEIKNIKTSGALAKFKKQKKCTRCFGK